MKLLVPVFLLITLSIRLSGQTPDTLEAVTPSEEITQIIISETELEGSERTQDISGLLQSSRDIFISTAGYTFGQTRFKIRGYDTENSIVMINGIELNDRETGRAYWSAWGGLNDATRNKVIDAGISDSRYHFGGIGGTTNIIARASTYRKGVKLTYSSTNRSYRNRLMFLAATGTMENGWAFTLSGSRRWAEEGYVEGTFYDAWSYFLSAEKKINDRHSIGLIGFASPNKRGRNGVATQEAYDLAGTNYYNPYWGWQNGEKRNSRVNNYHQPMIVLSHYWDFDEKTSLESSVFYTFGRGGGSALDWYDAPDPRPDYYRNLPGWDAVVGGLTPEEREDLWLNDPAFRQLDWDHLYFVNRKNLYTVDDVDGVEGKTYTGNLSNYIIEDRRNDKDHIGFNSNFIKEFSEHITFSAGVNLSWFKGYKFKVVKDLLGGDFYLNIDKYAERDFTDIAFAQNDLNNPNQVLFEGDRVGYDYTANINEYKLFAQTEFRYARTEFFIGALVSSNTFWRTGHMRNGKFPDESYGDAEKQNFLNGGIKGGITYKVTGRNFITLNTMYLSRAPSFRDSYVSPRTRDHVVDELTSEKIYGADLSYIYRSPYLKSRITGYYTRFEDGIYLRSFYHEVLRSFGNYSMPGVDKKHYGIELGVEAKVTQNFTLTGVAAHGRYLYDSRPEVTFTVDNLAEVLTQRTAWLKNYRVGGFPQTALSGGIKYFSSKYIWGGVSLNYYDHMYLDLNPDRRTAEAVANYDAGYPERENVLEQERLDPAVTMDAYIGKSWRINDYYISVNFSVNNILNEQNFAFGGFEQYRYDPLDLDKFPPKYFYLYGRQYYFNINFRF